MAEKTGYRTPSVGWRTLKIVLRTASASPDLFGEEDTSEDRLRHTEGRYSLRLVDCWIRWMRRLYAAMNSKKNS